jgi:ABC-2 type transport system permease protein
VLGYAANMDVNTVHTAVFDQDKSVTSRDFIQHFQRSGYFKIDDYVDNYHQINEDINNGTVLWALVIPKDFEKNIMNKRSAPVQAIFDGSDGNKTSIAFGYVQGIVTSYSKNIMLNIANKTGMKNQIAGSLIPEVRVWYNPDLKTRVFMVPSIMGLILMVITTILMSMAIVKEREIGTLEQLIVTPISPMQLIIGKIIPFIILGFIDVLIVLGVMVFWFGIGIRGSFVFLVFSSFLFVLSTLGIGLFISTISKTQQQAMMVAEDCSIFNLPYPATLLYNNSEGSNFKRCFIYRIAAGNRYAFTYGNINSFCQC